MIKRADPVSVSSVFTREAKWFYKIPMYQRAYTWGQSEWTTLFNDIADNEPGYFLGTIICVNSSAATLTNVDFQLIDGQQRATSLSILLLAIYSKLKEYKNSFNENQQDKFKDIKKELVLLTDEDNNLYTPRLTLQVQDSNQEDYLYLLSSEGLIEEVNKPKNVGNRRIQKSFKCFVKCLDNYIEGEEKPVKSLFDLRDKVNNAVVVFIEVDSNKDAYMLFESLNNRGIPLSAIDLIKNNLIMKADNPLDKKAAEKAYKQWEKIIGFLGDEYGTQERFLRYYYNGFREEINEPYRTGEEGEKLYPIGYLATKSSLLEIYEKLIGFGYQEFLNELEAKAKIYSILINKLDENRVEKLKDSLFDLEHIQGTPSHLLLLYVLSNKDYFGLSYDDINSLIKYLVKFFVRRNFTDYPNTRNLNKIFMDAVSKIRGKADINVVETVCEFLKGQSSSDADFEKKLRDDVYTINTDSTRFLLCYYENKYSTKEIHTDLWARDNSNKYVWTIEHILPEGENLPDDWVKMIAGEEDGNRAKANELREAFTHKLGNLTLTGYNSTLSNMGFDKKMNRKDENGNHVGYRNGLKLNEEIVTKDKWTIQDIKNRTDFLVNTFLEDFKL